MNSKTEPLFRNPLISAWIMTYNQEDYIAQAIEGALSQECSFGVELVIGDDASTDRTGEICELYSRKHAPKINYIRYALNSPENYFDTLKHCKGKYIAMCEGDDFWMQPNKLEKQITFLEQNLNYTLVSANTLIINEMNHTSQGSVIMEGDLGFTDLLKNNVLGAATCATVFRKSCISQLALEFINGCPYGDWATWLACLSQGKGFVLGDQLGAYRRHAGGAFTKLSTTERAANIITMYRRIMDYFPDSRPRIMALLSKYIHPLLESNLDEWGYPLS